MVPLLKKEAVKLPFFLQLMSLIKDRAAPHPQITPVAHPQISRADTRSVPLIISQEALGDFSESQLRNPYQDVFDQVATALLCNTDLVELDQPGDFLEFIRNVFCPPASAGGLCLMLLKDLPVDQVAPQRLEETWMPIVQELPEILRKIGFPLNEPCLQKLTKGVLNEYLRRYVGSRPVPYPDFKRSLIPCDCPDCEQVNTFLADPVLEVATFPFDGHSFNHVNRFLADSYRDSPFWAKDPSTQAYLKTMRRKDDLDVTTEYLKGPRQRGMFVRKTTAQLKDREDEYEERRVRAREHFGKLTELSEVLGKEDYSKVMAALQSYAGDGDE